MLLKVTAAARYHQTSGARTLSSGGMTDVISGVSRKWGLDMFRAIFRLVAATLLTVSVTEGVARAESDYFAGKTISIVIPAESGSYHLYALLLASYMPEHVPGRPAIVPVSMGGAGGLRASNYVANIAPRDGTALYMMHQNSPTTQLLYPHRVQYDAGSFEGIGIIASVNSVLFTRADSKVASISDAREREIFLGSTGVGSYTYTVPTLLNEIVGTKFKIVSTYPGSGEISLAMERNEVAGMMTSLPSFLESYPDAGRLGDKIKVLLQVGTSPAKELGDVPMLADLATDENTRDLMRFMSATSAFARSLVAPAGIPEDRLAILRNAFEQTLRDPAFLEEVERRSILLEPGTWQTLENAIAAMMATPEQTLELARRYTPE